MPATASHAAASDPARSLWGPVTVRVAWELVLAGLPARPDVISEAREHVLRSLPAGASELEAEELTSVYVAEWLDRVRRRRYRRPPVDPDVTLPLTASWRQRLSASLDHVGDAVFRLHYGDGFPLETVARSVALDPTRLSQARGGIRESVRALAAEEGVSVRGWPDARLDAFIGRVARVAEPGCPGPGGLLTDAGRAHADRCPRCSRAVRLVRGGGLSPSDLFPPEGQATRPTDRRRVLALLLHPDARDHRAALDALLGDRALAVSGDAWIIDATDLESVGECLRDQALESRPARHHLRGAMVTGSGRWCRGRIVGPLPLQAVEAARARPWGEVMGVEELPAPLPPPPKATRWWLMAGCAVLMAGLAAAWVGRVRELPPQYPVAASFRPVQQGLEVRFDTDDLAVIDVVVRNQGRLEVASRAVSQDKGQWATGEGDYRVVVSGQEAVVLSSPAGIADLEMLVDAARVGVDPLGTLATLASERDARVGVARTPPLIP